TAAAAVVREPLRRRLLADALHVARLAHESRHARQAAALDADLGEDVVDQRRLPAIAQRRIDHLVGGAAMAATAAAVEAVDLQNTDGFHLLHPALCFCPPAAA